LSIVKCTQRNMWIHNVFFSCTFNCKFMEAPLQFPMLPLYLLGFFGQTLIFKSKVKQWKHSCTRTITFLVKRNFIDRDHRYQTYPVRAEGRLIKWSSTQNLTWICSFLNYVGKWCRQPRTITICKPAILIKLEHNSMDWF
jgi:hypothetical protein